MSGPWQCFPSRYPTMTGSALECSKLFSQYCWAQYLPVQHLTEGSGKPTVSMVCSQTCCLPVVPGPHRQTAQPLIQVCREPCCSRKASRQTCGLTFRAALGTDSKSGPEGRLRALLRTDFPPSCGSLPQTLFDSAEQKRTPSS